MRKNNKKGFTLVELLVVIAILAILATVSVVGYLSFTDKAKQSNDISLTKQMNTVLQGEETTSGKAQTMTEALSRLEDAGLDVEKLTPTSNDYDYIYDTVSGRMLLLDESKKVIAPEEVVLENPELAFVIVHTSDDLKEWVSEGYGLYLASDFIYLASDFNGEKQLTINKTVSVDVAANLEGLTIESTETKSIIVNSNLDNLSLEVPQANVDFYGDSTFVSAKVADESLHVYGHIQELELIKGHIVSEKNGEINTVNTEKATSGRVSKNGGIIGGVIESTNVTVDSGITIIEKEDIVEGFAGGLGTKESPYLISNEEEFILISSVYNKISYKEEAFYNQSGRYFKQIADLKISKSIPYFTGYYDGSNYSLTFNVTTDSLENGNFYPIFTKTFGEHVVIKNLRTISKSNCAITIIGDSWGRSPETNILYGTKNIKFENIITDSNDVVRVGSRNFGFLQAGSPYYYDINENMKVEIINCVNNASIYSLGGNGLSPFIGYAPNTAEENKVNFHITYKNCTNNGNIAGRNLGVGLLFGNYSGTNYYKEFDLKNYFTIENVKNNGSLNCVKTESNAYCEFAPNLKQLNEKYQESSGGKYLKAVDVNVQMNLYMTADNNFGLTTSDMSYEYNLVLAVNNIYSSADSTPKSGASTVLEFNSINKQDENKTLSSENFYAYDEETAKEKGIIGNETFDYTDSLAIEGYRFVFVFKNEKVYLIFEKTSNLHHIDSGVKLEVLIYNDGVLYASKSLK